jgi:tRNA uridine 5-carbamoylmethylation protein Kti12
MWGHKFEHCIHLLNSQRARRLALDDARRAMQGETGRVLVILDDTMHLRSMRRECWQLARSVSSAYVQIFVVSSLKQALNRNAQRPLEAQIPEHVIAKAATSFEDPRNSSCEWDRNTLVLENESFEADLSSL